MTGEKEDEGIDFSY